MGRDTLDSWDGPQELATWPTSIPLFDPDTEEILPFGITTTGMVKTTDGSFWISEIVRGGNAGNIIQVRRVFPDGSMIIYPVYDQISPLTPPDTRGYLDAIPGTDGVNVWLAMLVSSQVFFSDSGSCPAFPIPLTRILPGWLLAVAIFASTGPSPYPYGLDGDAFYIIGADGQQTSSDNVNGHNVEDPPEPSTTAQPGPPMNANGWPPLASIFGFAACASPAEPGVFHVTWGESGYAGNYNDCEQNGGTYEMRLSYVRAGTNSIDQTDLALAFTDWSELQSDAGSISALPIDVQFMCNIVLKNDHGSPVAFVNRVGGYDLDGFPAVVGDAQLIANEYVEMWDLSDGSINIIQKSIGVVPSDFNTIEFSSFNTSFESGIVFNEPLLVSAPIYDDALVGKNVYLIGVRYFPASSIDGEPNNFRFIIRVPVDGSGPFDFMDGSEAAATGIEFAGLADFVSEPRNVWWPSRGNGPNAEALTYQYDRVCTKTWIPNFEAAPEDGIQNPRGVDLAGNLLSFVSLGADNAVLTLTQQVIARNYYPCSTGMHVWETV